MIDVTPLNLEQLTPQLFSEMLGHPAPSWFCCGTVVCNTEVLVIKYFRHYKRYPDRFVYKFPGGSGEGVYCTPATTLEREVRQEVLAPDGKLTSWTPFCRIRKGSHFQYAAILELEGPLREKDYFEDLHTTEQEEETLEKLGPPEFVDISLLAKKEEGLFFSHRPFLLALARTKLSENGVWFDVADTFANVGRVPVYDE